jgi:hypothetical protein
MQENQDGTVGPGFQHSHQKCHDKNKLGRSNHVENRLSEPAESIEGAEYFGRVIWLYQFVQGPEQEHDKDTETQQQQGEG